MKANYGRVTTRFGPETRFELKPTPAAPFRALQEIELEVLKNRLLRERLARTSQPALNVPLRRAANDAAALAWVTAYPLLVFPVLFEEQALTAVRHARLQEGVRERSRELLAA
ncbi:MAG: hypothetical protein IH623_13200 [Verrucomicrobia bacterium]|nr:hypothetical protein [Verrucomicrobiota bacterium]